MPKRKAGSQKASKRTKRTKRSGVMKKSSSSGFNSKSTVSTNVLRLGGTNRIMPQTFHTVLEITDTTNTRLGSGGGLQAGAVYIANGIYDYTTALGNSTVPGFNVFAPIYRAYRVKGIKATYRCTNVSAEPIIMQMSMFNTGSALFPTWSDLRQLASNKWCKEKQLSAKGGQDKGELSFYVNLGDYIGDPLTYNANQNFIGFTGASGTAASNPTNPLELRVYALSADGVTVLAANAAIISVNIIYYVEFFGLQSQSG